MEDQTEVKGQMYSAENIEAGEISSRLSGAIFFLLCFVPIFSTILFGAVDSTTWIFISIFWAMIVLLWLTEAWKAKGFVVNSTAMQLPLIGLIIIGAIQVFPLGGGGGGELLTVPVSKSLSMDPYSTRLFVVRLIVYFVYFAACLAFINNEKRLRRTVLMIIIFGALMAFFGIMQRLANPEGIYGLRGTPQAIPFGPFVNQHHFAAFMQMTGGVSLGLLFNKKLTRDKKILLTLAAVLMGVATVFTSSRGGLLGFVAMMAFVGIMGAFSGRKSAGSDAGSEVSGRQRKALIVAAGAGMILVIFGVVLILGGNESLFRGIGLANADADISSGRSHFWPIAIKIFLQHPIIGAGYDAFGVAFTRFDSWTGALRVEQAHNEYLQMLADSGLLGFSCVVAFLIILFKKGTAMISAASGFRRNAAIGALAGCFGIMIHSFFDFPLRTPSNAFFFLLLAAIAIVPILSEHGTSSKRRRTTT